MDKITVTMGTFVGSIIALVLVSLLLAWPTMELWNGCLVPAVKGFEKIEWLQAWGLQILINMLFKLSIVNKQD
jgi:hypothetical protein